MSLTTINEALTTDVIVGLVPRINEYIQSFWVKPGLVVVKVFCETSI